jgi:hypothetical protein
MKNESHSPLPSLRHNLALRTTALMIGVGSLIGCGTSSPNQASFEAPAAIPVATAPEVQAASAIETPAVVAANKPAARLGTLMDVAPVEIIPENMRQRLAHDTVYINFYNQYQCSGTLIRNEAGIAEGFSSAAHCGTSSQLIERYHDNGDYISVSAPITVFAGNDFSNLELIGEAAQVVVPATDDNGHDHIIGSFAGFDPEDVYADLSLASKDTYQPAILEVGEPAYMSGWPQHQNNEIMTRQEWPMTFLGAMDSPIGAPTTGSRTLGLENNSAFDPTPLLAESTGVVSLYVRDIQVFGIKNNENGAGCTPMTSGARALTAEGDTIGSLTGVIELTPNAFPANEQDNRDYQIYYEQQLHVTLSDFDTLCFIDKAQVDMSQMETYDVRVG